MISVIIPTYKPSEYIWKSLDSLQGQTLSKNLFEVIIVLNGCDQPYREILEKGINNYPEMDIRLLHTDLGGVSNARNIALEKTRGDYVCFLDDDDWLSPSYLESLRKHVAVNIIAVSNVIDYEESTGSEKDGYITRAYRSNEGKDYVSLFAGRSFMSSSCCKMIPRSLIGKKRFNVNYRLGEDALFMASISGGFKCIAISSPDAIYYRRLRSTSASRSTKSRSQKVLYALRLSNEYIHLYFSDIRRNSLPFFLTRIAASLLKIVKKSWI